MVFEEHVAHPQERLVLGAVVGELAHRSGTDHVVEPVVKGEVDREVESDLLGRATGEYSSPSGAARRSAMWPKAATNRCRHARST